MDRSDIMKFASLAKKPIRKVDSKLALGGEVHIYDEIPEEYGTYNEPQGFEHIRGFFEAVLAVRGGRKLAEIHEVAVTESAYQFIFTAEKKGKSFNPWKRKEGSYEISEDTVLELTHILGAAFSTEISFRFRDVAVLNPGRN